MRFRNLDNTWRKSLSFAVVHLCIAVAVGYVLTRSLVLASAFALIEPTLNTLVHHRLERAWPRLPAAWRRGWLKSLVFTLSHLVIAAAVGWALTGSLALAGAQALIEPLVNGAALLVFDRWWAQRERRRAGVVLALAMRAEAG